MSEREQAGDRAGCSPQTLAAMRAWVLHESGVVDQVAEYREPGTHRSDVDGGLVPEGVLVTEQGHAFVATGPTPARLEVLTVAEARYLQQCEQVLGISVREMAARAPSVLGRGEGVPERMVRLVRAALMRQLSALR